MFGCEAKLSRQTITTWPSGQVRVELVQRPSRSGVETEYSTTASVSFACEATGGATLREVDPRDAMRSGSNFLIPALWAPRPSIHGRCGPPIWFAFCQQRGLVIPPSGSMSLACRRNADTARDRVDSSTSGPVCRRPPSIRYKASSRVLCHFPHSVNVDLMECERYECHVRVLIARRPCLRFGKFWSSCSGLCGRLPRVTTFSVIVCFFLARCAFPGSVDLGGTPANMIVTRNAPTRVLPAIRLLWCYFFLCIHESID